MNDSSSGFSVSGKRFKVHITDKGLYVIYCLKNILYKKRRITGNI